MSEAVAAMIGTEDADVAVALSVYQARTGTHATASTLLGPGVDLEPRDAPTAPSD
jgi:hypothetical protein